MDHLAFPLWDPWYTASLFFPQVSHGEAHPSLHTWVFSGQSGFASSAQIPNPREILDLQIRWRSREAVPIFFHFVLEKITHWSSWVDRELSDGEFVSCLQHVRVLKSVAISRNLEGFRDVKGLRHLMRHWCPSLHTFFFSVGELTITLEDVVNNFLLPMFSDENPFDINLSSENLKIEYKHFSHFVERTTSSGGKLTKMGNWVMSLSQEKERQ